MAIIPLKQSVEVVKYGEPDRWGDAVIEDEKTYKARIDNSVKEVMNNAGVEVISTAQVWLNKYPFITYEHEFKYTDEHGNTIARKPELIEPIRMINGKPTLTIVYL